MDNIESILVASPTEEELLSTLMDEDNGWNDLDDPVAEGWTKIATRKKQIFLQRLFDEDVKARASTPRPKTIEAGPSVVAGTVETLPTAGATPTVPVPESTPSVPAPESTPSVQDAGMNVVVEYLKSMEARIMYRIREVEDKIDLVDGRLKEVERLVRIRDHPWDNEYEDVHMSENVNVEKEKEKETENVEEMIVEKEKETENVEGANVETENVGENVTENVIVPENVVEDVTERGRDCRIVYQRGRGKRPREDVEDEVVKTKEGGRGRGSKRGVTFKRSDYKTRSKENANEAAKNKEKET